MLSSYNFTYITYWHDIGFLRITLHITYRHEIGKAQLYQIENIINTNSDRGTKSSGIDVMLRKRHVGANMKFLCFALALARDFFSYDRMK